MMICTVEAHRKCPFNIMCDVGDLVADDSECADFIMKVATGQDVQPVKVDLPGAVQKREE